MSTDGVIPSGVKEFNWFIEKGGCKDRGCLAARTVLQGIIPEAEITCVKHCPFTECIGEELGNNKRKKWLESLQFGFQAGRHIERQLAAQGG